MINFVRDALEHGGILKPLLIPPEQTNGTGLFNPTILNDNGSLIGNVRHCQYTIYHSELGRFEHEYGPLVYLNPENDITLTTTNFFCTFDNDLSMTSQQKVNTSRLDVKPLWEFVGLEDARIVKWHERIYYCGVRRDTTTHGEGRMELSEIEFIDGVPTEVSRQRMPAPPPNSSYCEKNWMPIADIPFHFVKWSNPTEVVRYDPVTRTTETVFLGTYVQKDYDFRGGSQVIKWKDYYICISHSVNLYNSEAGRKNADYFHSFIVWDKNWNVVKYTDLFKLLGAKIEFSCGMCSHGEDLVITFGYQDNAAYILKVPGDFFERFLNV